MESVKSSTEDRELIVTRLLNAPVELVWEVWTNPQHIARWWGPDGFTNTIHKMDVRPGGQWLLVMHGPDGTDYDNESTFLEIVPFRKIVYEHFRPHIIATITFQPKGEQTELHWHMVFDSRQEFLEIVQTYKADEGLKQNVEKLANYLLVSQSNG